MPLTEMKCEPCRAGTPPLSPEQVADMAKEIPGWTVKDNKVIEREFRLKDFREAINFINQVADIAEQEDHHPDIYVFYNKVRLELSTHKIGGLSRNDFILAAKIDQIPAVSRQPSAVS